MDYSPEYAETNEINRRENEMVQDASLLLQNIRQQQQIQQLQTPYLGGIGAFNFRVPSEFQPNQQAFNRHQRVSSVNNTVSSPISSPNSSTSSLRNSNSHVLLLSPPSAPPASSEEQERQSPRSPSVFSGSFDDVGGNDANVEEDEDASSNASPDLLARLVDAIVKYPIIWNTYLRCYKKEDMKEEAWKKLAAELGETEVKLKHEWGKLRENFRKCIKKRELKTRSGSGKEKLPTCKFFHELQFLKDTLINKETDSNIVSLRSKRKEVSTVENNIPQQPSSASAEGSQQISTTPVQNKRHKPQTDNTQMSMLDEALVDTLNKVNQRELNNNNDKDADTLFCLSLVTTLKSLPTQKNSLVKLKIQQLLYEVQFDQDN